MLKRLVIILLLLNIFPFVYHKHFIGVHSAQAGDFFASEDDPWNDGGGDGGDDGGDDGNDDDDDDNCTDPGSTSSENLINTYITNGQEWGTYEVTTTDNCTGESSSYRYDALIDDCTSPSDKEEWDSEPHDYYLSGDAVYAKITHTTYNSCNQSSTSYDEDVYQEDQTEIYQEALDAKNSGEQLHDVTGNVDPTEHVGADGVITRNAHPVWPMYREKFGGEWAQWTAFYDAVHYKDGSAWKFQSLSYRNCNLTSGVIPLCIDYTVTVNTSTINIAADSATANAYISYTVLNKISCLFGYQLGNDTKTDNKTFLPIEGVY